MLVRIMLLIIVYLLITIVTGVLLFLIIKYMKEKPFGAQFVADHLSADLALSVFSATAITSFMIIAREIRGPMDEFSVNIFLTLQQVTINQILFNCTHCK